MKTSQLSNLVKNWYRLYGTHIPRLGTSEYQQFISGVAGLFKTTTQLRAHLPSSDCKSFVIWQSDSAYFQPLTGQIIIPTWYLSKDALEKINSDLDASEKSIILVNGSMIHESLHSCWDKIEISSHAMKLMRKCIRLDGANITKLFVKTFNLVEDLFIERSCPKVIYSFVAAKNALFFDKETFEKIKADLIRKLDPDTFINFLTCLKNDEFRTKENLELLASKLVELGIDIDGTCTKKWFNILEMIGPQRSLAGLAAFPQEHRVDFAQMLAIALSKLIDISNKSGGDSLSKESSDKSEDEEAESKGYDVDQIDGGEAAAAEEFEGLSKKEKMAITRMAKAIKKANEELREGKFFAEDSHTKQVPDLVIKEIEESSKGSYFDAYDDQILDSAFLRQLKNMRNVNHTYGMPLTSGSVMVNTRLSRIATDGKIFAHREEVKRTNDPVEVIILIDGSGSTYGKFRITSETSTMLCAAMQKAGLETFYALRELNIPASIFTHTGQETPTLYHVNSYRMTRPSKNDRMSKYALAKMWLGENYDGIVYHHMPEEFSKSRRSKILIVLSDGVPHGHHYGGEKALDHTKSQLKRLREEFGITVICLSIGSKDVFFANSQIFGEKFTMDITTNISEKFQNVLASIGAM